MISAGGYLAGLALLALELGCTGIAAWLLSARRFGALTGAVKAVAFSVLWTLGMVLVQVVPLACGVLTRGTVAVASIALLAGALTVPATPRPANNTSQRREIRHGMLDRASYALAAAGALAFAGFGLAWLSFNVTVHTESVDALSFHFPGVIRYIQTGSLWHIAQYLPQQAQGNYPQSGDMLMLALVLPWHSFAFVRLFDPVLLGMAAIAIYALAVELGAPKPTSVLVALAVCAIRPTLGAAYIDVLTDPAFLLGFSAGALFLTRYRRTNDRSDLILAGLGFGLALGTKWYAVTDIPIVVIVWIAADLLRRRAWRSVAGDTLLLAGVALASGGIWLLRNWILTGNPVFDYKVAPFGLTIFAAPPNPLRTLEGFTILHYIGHFHILRTYVWPVFKSDFGLIGLLFVLGALATGISAIADRARSFGMPLVLAVASLGCALAYFATPYSAQGLPNQPVLVAANTRYGAPALLLAAPLLALAAARLPKALRLVLDAALVVLTIIDVRKYLVSTTGRNVLAIAIVAAVAAALYYAPRLSARVTKVPRLGRTAVVATLAAIMAVLGYHYQKVLARRPYLPGDPTVSYVLDNAPPGTRIGITGTWLAQGLIPVAPLFGPRLQNHLSFVGPWVEHRLESSLNEHSFIAALTAGRFAYLEVGTGFPPHADPLEARWAAAAGYRVVTASERLILMRRA